MNDLVVRATWEEDGRLCLLVVEGEARLETSQVLETAIDEIAARRPQAVLADLSALQFMDSASVGAVLRLHARLGAHGGTLVLFGLQRRVARLVERLGLVQLHVEPDEMGARGAIA